MAAIVSIGEILWDIFPDRRLLGGATYNFSVHAATLGSHWSGHGECGRARPTFVHFASAGRLRFCAIDSVPQHSGLRLFRHASPDLLAT